MTRKGCKRWGQESEEEEKVYRLLRWRIEKKTDEMNKNDFNYHTKERRNFSETRKFWKEIG